MKTRSLFVALAIFGGLILSACGAAATQVPQYEAAATEAPAFDVFAAQELAPAPAGAADAAKQDNSAAPTAGAGPLYSISAAQDESGFASTHMIIKNADVKLLVEDTDQAIDRATQIVGDLGGYIISSRAWSQPYSDGNSYNYATMTMAMPVAEFEHALVRFRGLALKVLDSNTSGEDVSSQYVDLQSQLTNLQATRDRIKSFLDQARTVDEALLVNQQLADVEGQIEQIQGQMNYLHDRSAFSTLTVNFEPKLPELATPTPTPTATPLAWQPGQKFNEARKSVTYAYQGIIDFLIWVLVVFVPLAGPPLLIVWGIWKLLTRGPKKSV